MTHMTETGEETFQGLAAYHLGRTYGRKAALEGLDLLAPVGQVTGILGPNGCGKSTTLRILAGALASTSGWFEVNGVRGGVDRLMVKERTGYIPDVGGVFPRLTGWEHLTLTARMHKLSNWEKRASTLLEEFGLEDSRNQLASTYSHGMARKLSAAVALLPDPYILLADEPFDGVDADGVETLTQLMAAHASQGNIVILSTHLLDIAAKVCSTVTLVKSGKPLAWGTPGDLGANKQGGLAATWNPKLAHETLILDELPEVSKSLSPLRRLVTPKWKRPPEVK
jgi:ABC-2 type transport system ATP-binding protein